MLVRLHSLALNLLMAGRKALIRNRYLPLLQLNLFYRQRLCLQLIRYKLRLVQYRISLITLSLMSQRLKHDHHLRFDHLYLINLLDPQRHGLSQLHRKLPSSLMRILQVKLLHLMPPLHLILRIMSSRQSLAF